MNTTQTKTGTEAAESLAPLRPAPAGQRVAESTSHAPLNRPSTSFERPVENEPRPRRWRRWSGRKWAGFVAGVIGACALGYAGVCWWAHASAWIKTDNAYVAGHVHTISARVAGTVQEVLVEENQEVAAGAVLARLDPRDLEVARQQALARLAQAQAGSQSARAQVSQANAQVSREQARATKALQDLERARTLYEGNAGAISQQDYDQAKAEAAASSAALRASESALESTAAAVQAATALEEVAQAQLREAELQLSYSEIRAPAAGRIGRKNLETGNRVQPGQALLALVQPDTWITANFKETQLTHMKSGQRVAVRIDAFPSQTFTGRVESVSPASGAQFALLPPDNATGNFTRIVQRVPVKIVLDDPVLGEFTGRIVPGMSAIVEVHTGRG